jgi:hypothetical protein
MACRLDKGGGITMNVGTCKLCGNEKELIRAHIIPKSFYPADEKGNRMQIVLDGRGHQPSRQLQNGYYDPNLVCRECEDFFNAGDDYAKRLLLDRRSEAVRKTDHDRTYFEYSNVDYTSIKLFFISLLWRAHATTLPSFDKVDIGVKYEAIAREMIYRKDPGLSDDFAVFMLRVADGLLDKIGASPTPRKMPPNNVRVYEFLLFGYIAYVKVGQQQFGYPFRDVQLAPGKPFRMLEKAIEETPFLRVAKEAILMEGAVRGRLRKSR